MWLWHTITTSDDQFLASAGLDALVRSLKGVLLLVKILNVDVCQNL